MNPDTSFFVPDESAVTSIEYALLGSLIAVAIVVSVATLGISLNDIYKTVSIAIAAAA